MRNRVSIYVITNRINGKQYVGQTIGRPRDRVSESGAIARRRIKQWRAAQPIGLAVIEFGVKAFDCAVLQVVTRAEADDAERRWIIRLGTLEPNGYNCVTGGQRGFVIPPHVTARQQTPFVLMQKAHRARGEGNIKAKLTEAQVLEIRSRYAAGGIFQRTLAEEYGVVQSAIGDIVRRKHWKHI